MLPPDHQYERDVDWQLVLVELLHGSATNGCKTCLNLAESFGARLNEPYHVPEDIPRGNPNKPLEHS